MTEPKCIQVTVTVDFGLANRSQFEKTVTVIEKSTVLDALWLSVPVATARKYGMDHFVEQIDGVKNDFVADCGWRFQVNGRGPDVPAERYLLKDGAWINWSYVSVPCT